MKFFDYYKSPLGNMVIMEEDNAIIRLSLCTQKSEFLESSYSPDPMSHATTTLIENAKAQDRKSVV